MPPLPPVNKVAKVIVYASDANNHNYENSHYYGWTGAAVAAQSDMTTLATNVFGEYASQWAPQTSEDIEWQGAKAFDLSASSGFEGTFDSPTAGDLGQALLPSVCAVISWQGGPRFRGGHPRTYLPGIATSDVLVDGTLTGAAVVAAGNLATGLQIAVPAMAYPNITGVFPCWVNYHTGFTAVENPITHRWRNVPNVNAVPPVHEIVGFSVSPRQRSQRRRLRPSPVVE